MRSKNGIALLITLFFIIAITVLVGVGLRHVNSMASDIQKEKFLLQSRLLLDDVLSLLKTSQELDSIVDSNSSEGLFVFLSQVGYLPLSTNEMEVILEIESARAKLNPNVFKDTNTTFNIQRVDTFKEYLNRYNVDYIYADLLLDAMMGVKENFSYNTDIFTLHPKLFRDYLASKAHLGHFNNYFRDRYRYNTLTQIDFDSLFYYSKKRDTSIDLNFAKPELWKFLLGCEDTRAEQLYALAGMCSDYECFELSDFEKERLERFDISFYESVLFVKVSMFQNDLKASITFEYDMKSKKGSNFVYEI
jgi:hypothetical protein